MNSSTVEKNRRKEECLRCSTAEEYQSKYPPIYPDNKDLDLYEDHAATFSKSLSHDQQGIVYEQELKKMEEGVWKCKCHL